MRLILTLLIALAPGSVLWAQGDASAFERPVENVSVSPLVVVRNIDAILGSTKLEAMQSGQSASYAEKVNVAKSFVHGGKMDEAKKSYDEVLDLIWGVGDHTELSTSIQTELARANRSLSNESRPEGLDENYQPTNQTYKTGNKEIKTYYPTEAANKIDEMLEFLLASVYRNREEELTLKGKLNDCRQLIIMEQFDAAKAAYHKTIIQHLDPKWTGELLEDINHVLEHTKDIQTRSELDTNLRLTNEEAVEEINLLLSPVTSYFSDNQVLSEELNSFYTLLLRGRDDDALAQLNATMIQFASPSWVENRNNRIQSILSKRKQNEVDNKRLNSIASDGTPPILYFTDTVEGRQVEQIRIIEDNELLTYKKVTHNWGGTYYFINDKASKDTEWERVWRLYEAQQNDTSNKATD